MDGELGVGRVLVFHYSWREDSVIAVRDQSNAMFHLNIVCVHLSLISSACFGICFKMGKCVYILNLFEVAVCFICALLHT